MPSGVHPAFVRCTSGLYPVTVRPSLRPSFGVCISTGQVSSGQVHSEEIVDSKFDAILNNLPAKQPRSRLEPYSELITEMRKRGRTYREITNVLKKACGLKVGASTVNDFVLARSNSKAKRFPSASKTIATNKNKEGLRSSYKDTEARERTGRSQKALEGIARTIKELKGRPPKTGAKKLLFEYNPDEPLRLQHNKQGKE
jgi:hypothetical protein